LERERERYNVTFCFLSISELMGGTRSGNVNEKLRNACNILVDESQEKKPTGGS